MLSPNKQEREVFLKLARSQDGEIMKGYISKIIKEVTDIENIDSDAIVSMRNVKNILTSQLLENLTESVVEQNEEDSYE